MNLNRTIVCFPLESLFLFFTDCWHQDYPSTRREAEHVSVSLLLTFYDSCQNSFAKVSGGPNHAY